MNQQTPLAGSTRLLPRLTLLILTLFLGVFLAACAQEPNTPGDTDLGFEEQNEGLEQGGLDGTQIPGQGGLSNEPNEPVVTSPEAVTEGETATEGMITLDDIAENPEQYIGQMVTIRAPLGEILDSRAFTLSDPDVLGLDSLLVVGATESSIPLEEGVFGPDAAEAIEDAQIEVTGMVQQFDSVALEQELGYEFPDPIFGTFDQQTAIVAESVQVLSAELAQ